MNIKVKRQHLVASVFKDEYECIAKEYAKMTNRIYKSISLDYSKETLGKIFNRVIIL